MIMKKQSKIAPSLQLNDMLTSVTSEGSISNFVAQTPKQNRPIINFKKTPKDNQNYVGQKQNNLQIANNQNTKGHLPYKMITSQFPAPCSNHPEKQSSFYIESDQNQCIFYCQKCAILVASQGFQVKKIQSNCKQQSIINNTAQNNSVRFSIKDTKTIKKSKMNDYMSKQQKQTQLTDFLNNLQRIQTRIDKVYNDNQASLVQIDTAAQNQSKNIKQLFTSLHKVLDSFQQMYLEELQNKCIGLRQHYEVQNQTIENDTNTLQSMKQDICQAYDDIISHTTNSQFQTVMNAYKQNTGQIQFNLQNIQTKPLPLGGPKKQIQVQIKGDQIVQQIQKQIISKVQGNRRLSIKSTKRRISIGGGNKIR